MIISTNELICRTEVIKRKIGDDEFTISVFAGSILESSQKEPFKYLTSTDVPIVDLIDSGKIYKNLNGVINYPDYINNMDREYIECNYEEYLAKIQSKCKHSVETDTLRGDYFIVEDSKDTKLEVSRILSVNR